MLPIIFLKLKKISIVIKLSPQKSIVVILKKWGREVFLQTTDTLFGNTQPVLKYSIYTQENLSSLKHKFLDVFCSRKKGHLCKSYKDYTRTSNNLAGTYIGAAVAIGTTKHILLQKVTVLKIVCLYWN